jgi:hypothetical protein
MLEVLMKRWVPQIIAYIVMLGLAAGGYFLTMGMMDSIYAYRSPIHSDPPVAGASVGEPLARQVVVVLIDGLRLDTSLDADVMPNLGSLRQYGAFATMHSQAPSYSEPSYSVIFTGAWPSLSDGPAFNDEYEDIPTWTQDNLFSAVARSGGSTAISGYYWFEKLVPQFTVKQSFYTPGEDQAADREVVDQALLWLESANHRLVLIHLDQVDYAGHHEGGSASEGWLNAAARTDALLGEILESVDLSQDAILVISDHGHILMGGHGGADPDILVQPFVLAGKNIVPGDYGDVDMVDVASTLAVLMGTNLPASSQGQVRTAMLDLDVDQLSALALATRDQQTQLVNKYAAAIQAPAPDLTKAETVSDFQAILSALQQNRLTRERLPRFGLALLTAAIAIFLIIRFQKKEAFWLLLGGLAGPLIFLARYALIDGLPFSFSAVPGVMEFVVYIAKATITGILFAWAGIALLRGWFRRTPWEAARQSLWLSAATLITALLSVLAGFAWNGLFANWILPDMTLALITLLFLVHALLIAASAPLLSLLAAGFSAMRKR